MNRKDPLRPKDVLSAIEQAGPEQLPADAVHALLLEQATARPLDFVVPDANTRGRGLVAFQAFAVGDFRTRPRYRYILIYSLRVPR
jgi:hypothetical protein